MSWLDDYLNELNNFDITDPKNIPASNVKEQTPWEQSPLGKSIASIPDDKDFSERVKELQSTTLDAAGNKIAKVITQRQPSSADLAAYAGNLDFLGLGQSAPSQSSAKAAVETPAKPLPDAIVKHLMQKKEALVSNGFSSNNPNNPAPVSPAIIASEKTPWVLDKFSPAEYDKAKQLGDERNSDLGWAQFAAGVGSALARRDPSEVAGQFDKIRERNKDETVGEFNRQKASAIQDIDTKNKISESDPNSQKNKLFQDTVNKLYPNKFDPELLKTLTAKDSELLFKPLELNAKLEENKINNQMKNETLRQGQADRKTKSENDSYIKARQAMETFRGNAGVQQASKDVLSADKALRLVQGKDPNKLTTQDLRLLAEEMGKIASGGVPSEHGTTGLMPNNLQTKYAEIKNYLTSNPTDANSAEYIKHNMAYLKEMRDVASNSIDSYRENIAKGYKHKLNKDDYEELQNDYGLNKNIQRNTASLTTEVERRTSDGKVAIFDANTKTFLRYK